jgi:ergothioneine biosynthesis protein EgtB
MTEFLASRGGDSKIGELLEIGLNHEQQHQELLLTDIKHAFSCNPLQPVYRKPALEAQRNATPLKFVDFAGGLQPIGASGEKFCFDNETPRHASYLQDYALANRLVTNGEYLEFVRDGGYRTPQLWLADGWAAVQSQHWSHPIYWNDCCEHEFTLSGEIPLDLARPVSHLSFYEAEAFARWSGARLPVEGEWEAAAALLAVQGNLLESARLHPSVAVEGDGLLQMFGDVWEWTASAYSPYPGYRPAAGALGEYNGKFMVSQLVLRGGSCVTPRSHIRATYRNFFYPQARWQFTGLRLAKGI